MFTCQQVVDVVEAMALSCRPTGTRQQGLLHHLPHRGPRCGQTLPVLSHTRVQVHVDPSGGRQRRQRRAHTAAEHVLRAWRSFGTGAHRSDRLRIGRPQETGRRRVHEYLHLHVWAEQAAHETIRGLLDLLGRKLHVKRRVDVRSAGAEQDLVPRSPHAKPEVAIVSGLEEADRLVQISRDVQAVRQDAPADERQVSEMMGRGCQSGHRLVPQTRLGKPVLERHHEGQPLRNFHACD
mmetsp:Transcript_889/g.2104  ORF Transcript_889/g.2104 Transcript_889/m.2104 type:complete len:237 (-) Transcript_889:409-1119(-)